MHNVARVQGVPDAFCWSRMGVESGQDLSRIVARKETERAANGGTFVRGIGSSIGSAVRELHKHEGEPTVIFSPMRSAAAEIDVNPAGVTLWLDYIGPEAMVQPLPAASIVTTRSETATGSTKRKHFALFCYSEEALGHRSGGTINFGELRNLSTGRAVGFSQVTAVVSRTRDLCSIPTAQYDARIVCQLANPYFAALCTGVSLELHEFRAMETAASSDDPLLWREFALELKTRLRKRAEEGDTIPLI